VLDPSRGRLGFDVLVVKEIGATKVLTHSNGVPLNW
jgi:hypothetical protein